MTDVSVNVALDGIDYSFKENEGIVLLGNISGTAVGTNIYVNEIGGVLYSGDAMKIVLSGQKLLLGNYTADYTISNDAVSHKVYYKSGFCGVGGYTSDIQGNVDSDGITVNNNYSGNVVRTYLGEYNANIYGAKSTANDELSNNTVEFKGGTVIGKAVYGAHSGGTVRGNKVIVTDGLFKDTGNSVYGGYSVNGDAHNNIVKIIDGSFNDTKIYGGYSENDNADDNVVVIESGDFTGGTEKIVGGYAVAGGAQNNTVAIKGGSLSAVDVYGGNATGTSSGNTLEVGAKNISVKSVNDFQNYTFGLKAVSNGDVMLSVTTALTLNNEIVNVTDYNESNLNQGDVITLISNVNGTFATITTDDYTISLSGTNLILTALVTPVFDVTIKPVNKTSGNIVTVTDDREATVVGEIIQTPKEGRNWKDVYGGYAITGDSTNNEVYINNGLIKGNVYGGYAETGNATGNFVTIKSGNIKGNVYGGYSVAGNASGNEIIWSGGKIEGELYGGYSKAEGKDVGNNWLQIVYNGETKTIKALNNFSSYVFDINTAKNGDTVLKVMEKALTMYGGQYTVVVQDSKNEALKYEGTVCLVDDAKGIVDMGVTNNTTETTDGIVTTQGRYIIEDGKKLIYIKTSKLETDAGAKAPVEGVAAAAATVNTSSDLAMGAGMGNLVDSTNNVIGANTDTFGAGSYGKARYNTGSHVDGSGYGIVVGVGKKLFDKVGNKTTGGFFFEYGNSNFDTYNTNMTGSGKSIYKGGGYMMRWDNKSGNYYEGMIHAGKISTNWTNKISGYDMSPTYYGGAVTYGHKFMMGENRQFSVYGGYTYSHTGGGDVKVSGHNYDFEATKSHRTKVGVRYALSDLMDTKKFRPYIGLAWEHEFNGESGATVVGLGRTASPSMKGDSGILELGFKQDLGKWIMGIGAELFTGKRRGWNGTLNATYNF